VNPASHLNPIFARSHRLSDGLRVRLRLARPGDQGPLVDLLDRLGFSPSESHLLDLVRFDRGRAVICATALLAGTERIVGFGAIDPRAAGASAWVVVDPDHAAELTPLIRSALDARTHTRAAA